VRGTPMAQGVRQATVRKLLARAATLALAALALSVPWSLLLETNPRAWIYLKGDPRVGRVVQEMAPLRAQLDPHATVGFASTLTSAQWHPGQPNFARDAYVMTRYALAPVLVRWNSDQPMVVAIFPDQVGLQEFVATGGATGGVSGGFKVVLSIAPGAGLLEREP
jgi:hypothetical protein